MRLKKEETIAKFKDEFLALKNEAYREKFETKNKEQQYIAIMNWKRNAKKLAESSGELAKVTVANVLGQLKEAHRNLTQLQMVGPKEAAKIQAVLDSVKDTINNFDKLKKQQEIKALKTLKNRLKRQGENLDKKIASLQQQLS